MKKHQRLFSLCIACLTAIAAVAQEIEEHQTQYEATQTDYGYFGTTDAVFSISETIICTFSLTQNKPKGDKIYPTMLSIWLHADAMATKSQELTVRQIAQAGSATVDGQFRHPATLQLENGEEVELGFSINNLTEGYTHHTVMLTAPISDIDNRSNTAMYGELATKLRRYDITAIHIANTTLYLQQLGFHSAAYINGICKELLLAGCNTASFNAPDQREADDFDASGFHQPQRSKSIDELVYHALGCFPTDIRNIKPATAVEIIRKNTSWLIDDQPDYHELGFTHEDGYDFTYQGLQIGAEMCWDTPAGGNSSSTDAMQLTGYNYYFKLYSKDKKAVRKAYHKLCEELEALGFALKPHQGEKGDKQPLQAERDGYHIQTCYYLNIRDQYVIQLQVKQEDN